MGEASAKEKQDWIADTELEELAATSAAGCCRGSCVHHGAELIFFPIARMLTLPRASLITGIVDGWVQGIRETE